MFCIVIHINDVSYAHYGQSFQSSNITESPFNILLSIPENLELRHLASFNFIIYSILSFNLITVIYSFSQLLILK